MDETETILETVIENNLQDQDCIEFLKDFMTKKEDLSIPLSRRLIYSIGENIRDVV